jgi:hypothetical protein
MPRNQARFSIVKARATTEKVFAVYDNKTGKVIPNFEGPKSEVTKMADAWNILASKGMIK